MKLYFAPRTRATRPRWLLEELGVPYELVRIDLAKKEHKEPSHLALHPHGAVPALTDGEVTIFESAAICLYLADKFPEKKLAPPVGSPARGLYYQWIVYGMATMEAPILDAYLNTRGLPEEKRSAEAATAAQAKIEQWAGVLEKALEGKPFLLGAELTTADVVVGSLVGWAKSLRLLEGHPVLLDYATRLTARPAYKTAQA